MPLRFDPAALMAQGGLMHGLDDMGSAVMNAMNRRAERRYADDKLATARSQQVEDRNQQYAKALDDAQRQRNFKWWHDAASAGPEDMPEYDGLEPDQITQLEAIRNGTLANRASRVLGAGGPSAIVPPSLGRTQKQPIVDEYGDKTGETAMVTKPRDFEDRVAEAEDDANKTSMLKGRGKDAQAQADYAAGGRQTATDIEHDVPWDPEHNTMVAAGKAAFDQGTTVDPDARRRSLNESLAQQEEANPDPRHTPNIAAAKQNAALGWDKLHALLLQKGYSPEDADYVLRAARIPQFDDDKPEAAASTPAPTE